MTHHTQLEEKLVGDDNFQAWKYKISLILEENDLDHYINGEVPYPKGDEAKDSHNIIMDKDKRIIANSIKDHLIPHVFSFKTLKEVYDSLIKMFEGKNINQKMTLRNQLKNVKIHNSDTIQCYFTRVARIKEQLEAVEENDLDHFINGEVPEPKGDEAKDSHKRSMDEAKRIIAYSIKDHLIPHVSAYTLEEIWGIKWVL